MQHCHEWAVQNNIETVTDFLQSLAQYLTTTDETNWLDKLNFWPSELPDRQTRDVMAFASQPLFKEDNLEHRRFYNLSECKVSTADSKRHDKRWEKVDSDMDGTFHTFMRTTKDIRNPSLLGMFQWMDRAFDEVERYSHFDARAFLKYTPEQWRDLWDAFRTCDSLIQATRTYHRTRNACIHNAANALKNRARKAEALATAAVAEPAQ